MISEIIKDLETAIRSYNEELAERTARKIVEQKIDVNGALEAMTRVMREIGDRFSNRELWLPDLVGAASVMTRAMPILEEELKKTGSERISTRRAIIGTVFGDLHTIGKDMVKTLLIAEGFAVHDLGTNVRSDVFAEAVKKHNADILAMSALMTTTSPEQKKTIDTLKREGLRERVKVIVGGGAITQHYAESIGADAYHPTAPGGAKLARKLVEFSKES